MKRRRRIEITAFRRRTTIILRESVGDNLVGPPPDDADTLESVLSDLQTRDVDLDLDQLTHAAQVSLAQLALSESTESSSTPELMMNEKESEIAHSVEPLVAQRRNKR